MSHGSFVKLENWYMIKKGKFWCSCTAPMTSRIGFACVHRPTRCCPSPFAPRTWWRTKSWRAAGPVASVEAQARPRQPARPSRWVAGPFLIQQRDRLNGRLSWWTYELMWMDDLGSSCLSIILYCPRNSCLVLCMILQGLLFHVRTHKTAFLEARMFTAKIFQRR